MVSAFRRQLTLQQREVSARVSKAEHPALLAVALLREAPAGTCLVCWRDRGERDEREGRPNHVCSRDDRACLRIWRRLRERIAERTQAAKESLLEELAPAPARVLELQRRQPPSPEDEARRAA